jgi:hypothetical protein
VGAAVVGAAEKYRETRQSSPLFHVLGYALPTSIRVLAIEVSKVSHPHHIPSLSHT